MFWRYLNVLLFLFISGCAEKLPVDTPEWHIVNSNAHYNKAVSLYREMISKDEGNEGLRLALGKLYFERGKYELAAGVLKGITGKEGKKLLAISFYRLGNFTDALEAFNKLDGADDEALYYLGLTCERLNLFNQAVKAYGKIKSADLKESAALRIEEIQRASDSININKEDKKAANIIALAPGDESYPQAGALILLSDEHITVTKEHTQESSLHYMVKILNERGKESFADTAIEYDSTFERLELVYARTIKPDGSVIYVGSRHIRDVSKYLNFPLYSNARVFIISFPEVVTGAVLEYKIRIKRNQLINGKDFFLSYPVQAYEPVLTARFSISLPKGISLNMKAVNVEYNDFNANLKGRKEENNTRYLWEFRDLPQILPESGMPPDARINPTILFSTFQSWEEVYAWWQGLCADKIKADKSIKDAVRKLIAGKKSDLEKARSIYNFCAKDIRYVAVEYGQAGYEPHAAAEIFRNKYGDCKDQSVLLVSMLREAGLKAYPVLIPTKQYYNLNEDLPSGLFNHCIAVLFLKDRKIFLDPTAETCSFGDLPLGDQGRKVLVFKENGFAIEEIPFYPASHNLMRQSLNLRINSDGSVSGEKNNFTLGAYDQSQRLWLIYTQPELIKDMLKGAIQNVSIGAKLKSYEVKNLHELDKPVALSYSFYGPEYFTRAGALRIFPQLSNLDTSLCVKDKRKYPVDLGLFDTKEFDFDIVLPDDFVVKYIPVSLKAESKWLSCDVQYVASRNRIYFKQRVVAKENEVNRLEYEDFKAFTERLARDMKQRIVLEKVK